MVKLPRKDMIVNFFAEFSQLDTKSPPIFLFPLAEFLFKLYLAGFGALVVNTWLHGLAQDYPVTPRDAKQSLYFLWRAHTSAMDQLVDKRS